MAPIRHMDLQIALAFALLALSPGCEVRMEPSDSEWTFDFSDCHSDDECPANEICTGLVSATCSWADVCTSDADCAPEEHCDYRMALGSPGASRKTCTHPPDDGCNPGSTDMDAAVERDAASFDGEVSDGAPEDVSEDSSDW